VDMKYTISSRQPNTRYIQIEAVASDINEEIITIQLPAWRPGRYELGNFAKNVRDFKVTDGKNKLLDFAKITKDSWQVQTKGVKEIKISYEYYAAELNAGSTFTDESQLYVNPVNCLVYLPSRINEPCELKLDVPEKWKIASAMQKKSSHVLTTLDFDTLADSPFIASGSLKHNMIVLDGVEFHFWFQGECKPEWPTIISDFFIFISEQMSLFGDAPMTDYHFLFQILPQRFYHGVEHLDSTVIALGPGYKLMGEVYNDFLGVSCHELFHAWNIKAIRPAEMVPYDYLLFRSGVWTEEEFWPTFEERMEKHFESHARHFYSVAESSFDTWLDGYTPGAPHRKTSIYHEGCLLAFVTDMFIRRHSHHKKNLDDVMRRLWNEFAKQKKGYTEADYKRIVEEESGADFTYYWNNYFNKAKDYSEILIESLAQIGYGLAFVPSRKPNENLYGFKLAEPGGITKVTEIYYGSPAEKAGLTIGDEIIGINGMQVKADLAEWMRYFGTEKTDLIVASGGHIKTIKLIADANEWYANAKVRKLEEPTAEMKAAFTKWSGRK
jgi:predicted metalloprotease with PDZ domain